MRQADRPEKTVLIGGAGFIGSNIARLFASRGHNVTIIDDFSTARRQEYELPIDVIEGSVLDRSLIASSLRDADLVFHLAGVVGMRLAQAERERAYAVAVDGARNILEAFGGCLVLFSSSAVYGHGADGEMHEAEPIEPAQALDYDGGAHGYASGKARMEELGREAAEHGQPVLIVRPFNVVGPGQTDAYGMVLPTFVRRALRGLPLQIYDDGLQSRSFCHVGAFADAVYRLVACDAAWLPGTSVFNIGCAWQTTIRELAELVTEEVGLETRVEFVPYETAFPGRRDVRHRRPNVERLRRVIGDIDWPPLRDVVRDVVAAERQRWLHGKTTQQMPWP